MEAPRDEEEWLRKTYLRTAFLLEKKATLVCSVFMDLDNRVIVTKHVSKMSNTSREITGHSSSRSFA